MKGKASCQQCGGRGFILDPNPLVPVRTCPCTRGKHAEGGALGIPNRYSQVDFEGFWDWWKHQHPKDHMLDLLATAHERLSNEFTRPTVKEDLVPKLELILHKCGCRMEGDSFEAKDLKPAQEPEGYRAFFNWSRNGRDTVDLWWIDGPAGSGRSSLAAACLKSCCERLGKGGLFVSVRTFSQELKDTYYDSRSFQNTDFMSERDRMAPLLQAPVLVLDDLDRLDSDIRVVRAMAQLLDQRYADERPTIATAARWAEASFTSENSPFARLEDPSLLRRLSHARRVCLKPTLERLMESLVV